MTIYALKKEIETGMRIPKAHQVLIHPNHLFPLGQEQQHPQDHWGLFLQDQRGEDQFLKDYGIKHGDTLFLFLSLGKRVDWFFSCRVSLCPLKHK